jgi:hypothetical protein
MKQTILSLPKTRLFMACLLLFSLFFVQQSCTKINTDAPAKLELTDVEVTQKFFKLPANAPAAVRRAADEMKRRNSQSSEFVKNFVKNNGYPAWDKAIIQSRHRVATASFAGSAANAEGGDTIVIIPVVQVDIAFVDGFVTATLNGAVNLDLYRGGDYSAYSFNNVPTDSISADKAAMQVMYFNYRVFGYTRFEVSDNRLLSNDAVLDTSKPHRVFEISSVQEPPQTLTGNESNLLLAIAVCVNIYQTVPCIGIFTDLRTANAPESNIVPGCRVYIGSECYTIYVDTGGGGSTSPTGGSDPGGGTGGGGTGGTFPCASSQGRTIQVANPCGPANPPPVSPIPATVTSIINNVQNPCLNQVYNMIQANTYKNKVASLLDDFNSATGITVQLEEGALTNAYAETIGLSSGPNDYQITFDNTVLPHCSQEFILATYFHEAIHVYLKEHLTSYDFDNISSHTEMLNQYFTDLKNTIHSYFPLMSDLDLWAIMYDDIDYDPNSAPDTQLSIALKHRLLVKILQQFPATDEASLHVIAEQYREGGALGTRNPSCN